MNPRQLEQLRFDESGQNLIVGKEDNCPIPPVQLSELTADSPFVLETFSNGLTAEVFHLRIEGKEYTLKKRRAVAKVNNLDGRFSFLNEVQRRYDLQKLKDSPDTSESFENIVTTNYADYRLGIILSPWLEGNLLNKVDISIVSQLFSTLLSCEQSGLFEWDLCAGNIIVDEKQHLWLFDFGYMYRFNPLVEFNSNGTSDPLFNFCERFETRYLSGWLLSNAMDYSEQIQIYRMVKQEALNTLVRKKAWLLSQEASDLVIRQTVSLIEEYQLVLSSAEELETRFVVEMFRSHVLDIEDDLDGKSCTPVTKQRVKEVIKLLDKRYDLLNESGALFYGNSGKKRSELIRKYMEIEQLVIEYQV
ncbi:phosphotransferase [Vibrio hannami]|uniref:phosphotransferase n=1 Tax=Vibrio hannami TaxID=2717094 RepID=UPI00241082EE|nr:phosphotransferase [Vibrio hannami]MDG3086103.1 phosphotransferase [Vibrio hannami]